MRISFELYEAFRGTQGIGCKEEKCPFRKECANHVTAGDFRSEDGIAPNLTYLGGEIHCHTAEEEIDPDTRFGTLPVNADHLSRGSLSLTKNGEIVSSENLGDL